MTTSASSLPDLSRSPSVDQVGVQERVERLTKRSIKKESKIHALKLALSMIDLTTLEGADSPGKVKQMCYKAKHLADNLPDIPHVAAVCVYPTLVRLAKKELEGGGINVAAVATGFPSGQFPLNIKLDDTRYAVGEGADEIDMVISRGHFLAGDYQYVFDEIAAIKAAHNDPREQVEDKILREILCAEAEDLGCPEGGLFCPPKARSEGRRPLIPFSRQLSVVLACQRIENKEKTTWQPPLFRKRRISRHRSSSLLAMPVISSIKPFFRPGSR